MATDDRSARQRQRTAAAHEKALAEIERLRAEIAQLDMEALAEIERLREQIALLAQEVTYLRERRQVEEEKQDAVGDEQDRKIEDRVVARATDDRSESDIALAHELGDKYGPRLQYPLQFERVRATGHYTFAHELLADLVSDVSDQLYADGRLSRLPALDVSARIKLTADLEDALRVLAFGREAKLGGVLVSVADGKDALQNGLGVAPLFDIFNPRARWMLGQMDAHAPNADLDDFAKLRTWVMGAVNTVGGVALVPQRQATKGFMTLFADSVHSVLNWFQNSNTSYVDYTFNSRSPGGLQVQYHPQHYTSPEVFGTTLSTPATQRVRIGHYHFLGKPREGPVIRDPAVFFASPNTSVGNTLAF
ncbi:hypothetical protein V1279_007562 [Bradyrhizobium sp. AZCC 1610]|uniref:hypothetical protein n=1 Tax=Bradyrhizobium sp. AZCC 1610 TaxID=3117020 RepID=UPI002FF20560